MGSKEKVITPKPGQCLWGERSGDSLEKYLGNKAGATHFHIEMEEVPLPFWARFFKL